MENMIKTTLKDAKTLIQAGRPAYMPCADNHAQIVISGQGYMCISGISADWYVFRSGKERRSYASGPNDTIYLVK